MYHGVSLDEVIAELPDEKATYDDSTHRRMNPATGSQKSSRRKASPVLILGTESEAVALAEKLLLPGSPYSR
jgi:hypothetical protein